MTCTLPFPFRLSWSAHQSVTGEAAPATEEDITAERGHTAGASKSMRLPPPSTQSPSTSHVSLDRYGTPKGTVPNAKRSRKPKEVSMLDDRFGLKLFNELNRECTQEGEFQIDIVAVHGLDGDRERTWTYKGETHHNCLWLRDLLPEDLPGSRIFTYGYNSKVFGSKSVSSVHEFAIMLLREIQHYRENFKARPIIFLAHSLGGIVTKMAIKITNTTPEFHDIKQYVQGLFFLGTPHWGSNVAWWGRVGGRIMWPMKIRRDLISDLVPNSEKFNTITEDFKHMAGGMCVFSYYEQVKTSGVGIIVSKRSAVIGFDYEHVHPLERDHKSMCRFKGKDDQNYLLILGHLKSCTRKPFSRGYGAADVSGGRLIQSLTDCMDLMKRNCGSTRSQSGAQPVSGTCRWFFEQQEYQDWLAGTSKSWILWLTGPFGFGKTLLSKHLAVNLAERVTRKLSPPIVGSVHVCYYSCDQELNKETTPLKMIITLLYQILQARTDLADHAMREWEKPGQSLCENFESLWNVFVGVLKDPRAGFTVIIIDAIDECGELNESFYIDKFNMLSELEEVTRKVRVLFTTQSTTGSANKIHKASIVRMEDIPYSDYVLEDVNMVINERVEELGRQRKYSKSHKELVKRTLCNEAGRSFLWIKYVIWELEQLYETSTALLEETIKKTPKDLNKRYEECLSKLSRNEDQSRDNKIIKLLKVTSASLRPFDLQEVGLVLGLSDNHISLSHAEQYRDHNIKRFILDNLDALLWVPDSRVQFVHNSVNAYLGSLSNRTKEDAPIAFAVESGSAHMEMAKVCTKYLTLTDFDKKDFDYSPDPDEDEVPSASDSGNLRLNHNSVSNENEVTSPSDSESLMLRGIDDLFEERNGGRKPELFDYCALNWTSHVALAGVNIKGDNNLLQAILQITSKGSYTLYNWLECYWNTLDPRKERHKDFDSLTVASYFRLNDLVRILIDLQTVELDISGPIALYWASAQGNLDIVQLLLSHKVSSSFRGFSDWTPLIRAAAAGHIYIVEALVSYDSTGLNDVTSERRTALSYAVQNGHAEICKILLSHKNIDHSQTDVRKNTPLIWAMGCGNPDIVTLLLKAKVDLNQENHEGRTALSFAAEYGNMEAVRMLLQQPTGRLLDPGNRDNDGLSPMLHAAKSGHRAIMDFLWQSGRVDIHSSDNQGFNAVIYAIKFGHLHVLEYLKTRDRAGFQAQDIDNTPALGFVFITNNERRLAVLEFLLQTKNLVKIDQTENDDRTVLFRAAVSGFVEGVECLIKKGAKVHVKDRYGKTPLQFYKDRSATPDPRIVKLLAK